MVSRVFSLLAALLLVGAFALATLPQDDLNLGQALELIDPTLVPRAQKVTLRNLWPALWSYGAAPLLVRPVWLLPASLGLICLGVAASTSSGTPSRTHRRRS